MTSYPVFKRKFFKTLFAVLFPIFILCQAAYADTQQSPAQVVSKSCLWSVKAGSKTIYLLGSLHVLKPDSYPLADAIEEAYTLSQKIVFETDIAAMSDPGIQQKMLELGLYPENQNLYQNLNRDTLSLLEKKMAELGLPPSQFARFKPWLLAVTLSTLELQRLGFNPIYGIDMHFFKRAKEDEKEIGYLEPIEYQLDLLGNMGKKDQNAFLSQTLKELDLAAKLAADLTTYWEKGEADNLYALLNKSFQDHPSIRNRLLIERNKMWVAQIKKLMQQNKNVLVVVGAGHLVGPDSVVDLLKKSKYELKQR